MSKTNTGNFFEDFKVGQVLTHATPRTLTDGDRALYQALFGSRFSLQSSDEVARKAGYAQSPVDDLLAFHVVFGKTVPDVSLNAVANLGYADCRFLKPVFSGDTLSTISKVIGLKENSDGATGVVYVRSTGRNQRDEIVLDYVRWVMVRKRDKSSPAPETDVPSLPNAVDAEFLEVPAHTNFKGFDLVASGSSHLWDDYAVGEKIDHVDGVTIEEAEHMMATRLYQNTAKVHFNQFTEGQGRFGRRLIYGGHVISLARSLSFNGLGNAQLNASLATALSPYFVVTNLTLRTALMNFDSIFNPPIFGRPYRPLHELNIEMGWLGFNIKNHKKNIKKTPANLAGVSLRHNVL